MTLSHEASVISKNGAKSSTPALFTSISSLPNVVTVLATAASMSDFLVTSIWTGSTSWPPVRIWSESAVRRSSLRAEATTFAPWLARATTAARPMPLLAPVTRATFPDRENIYLFDCVGNFLFEIGKGGEIELDPIEIKGRGGVDADRDTVVAVFLDFVFECASFNVFVKLPLVQFEFLHILLNEGVREIFLIGKEKISHFPKFSLTSGCLCRNGGFFPIRVLREGKVTVGKQEVVSICFDDIVNDGFGCFARGTLEVRKFNEIGPRRRIAGRVGPCWNKFISWDSDCGRSRTRKEQGRAGN